MKTQAIESATEVASMVLRIDDVIASEWPHRDPHRAECPQEWAAWVAWAECPA